MCAPCIHLFRQPTQPTASLSCAASIRLITSCNAESRRCANIPSSSPVVTQWLICVHTPCAHTGHNTHVLHTHVLHIHTHMHDLPTRWSCASGSLSPSSSSGSTTGAGLLCNTVLQKGGLGCMCMDMPTNVQRFLTKRLVVLVLLLCSISCTGHLTPHTGPPHTIQSTQYHLCTYPMVGRL